MSDELENKEIYKSYFGFSDTQTNCKESPPIQTSVQQNNIVNGNNTAQPNHLSIQSNNNKGENNTALRRGKSNIESKAQAVRNKHKNCQNKEKHGMRTTSRSESSSINTPNIGQINGQKGIKSLSTDTNNDVGHKSNNRCNKVEQPNKSKTVQEVEANGILNGEHSNSDSETDQHREGSTPASTASSSEESSVHQPTEHLGEPCEESHVNILGEFFLIMLCIIFFYIYSRFS